MFQLISPAHPVSILFPILRLIHPPLPKPVNERLSAEANVGCKTDAVIRHPRTSIFLMFSSAQETPSQARRSRGTVRTVSNGAAAPRDSTAHTQPFSPQLFARRLQIRLMLTIHLPD